MEAITTAPLEFSHVPGVSATSCYADAALVTAGQDSRLWAPGFAPGSQVQVIWEVKDGGPELVLKIVTASSAGEIATLVRPPMSATLDTYALIKVRGTNPDGGGHEGVALVGVARPCTADQ